LPQPDSPIPISVHTAPRKGEIFDRESLRRIVSFCIDTSDLSGPEQAGLRDSLSRQGQSKKLVDRLRWRLVNECSRADAVARVYYLEAAVHEVVVDAKGHRIAPPKVRQSVDPVLVIYDQAALRLYYRAEGTPIPRDAKEPLKDPLTMLVKDLQATIPIEHRP